ncbi:PREDICTED: synaptosomal-associated protein 29 [Nicrophorus vespilloides]|uniref:Synaptosomal-associated protein 29 n=1 Tax=Nicrophorus vespilloides TaxID=110193 RepID=A0ABM1MQZ6_NICVS|nr:PREDICTED: synaptosomal-associated protein 29 [Nicrophorus vespilloides]
MPYPVNPPWSEIMSSHRYTSSSKPFDEDDVDDETFLKNSRRSYNGNQSFDQQVQSFQERRKQIEDRTIQSTERSIGILRDSEQIGIATAEELSRQREQLERTDKRLDEINHTLRFSQKHINGIKSVFSSLKNYMSGRSDPQSPSSVTSSKTTTNEQPKQNMSDQYDRYENHPVTRLRGVEQQQVAQSGSKEISARLEANLMEMSSSISRLKGLATDLNLEIDTQNDLLDNITDKTEMADVNIKKQNKDMQRLLKK